MSEKNGKKHRDIFELLLNLSREIRCCSRDEAFYRNVTFQQFVILDAVSQAEELDLAALHGILAVEKSTTTRLLDPLLRKGLLTRDRATYDSRAATLSLTEAGRRAHDEVWDCLTVFFDGVTRNIGAEEREAVFRAVQLFAGALQRTAADCRCDGLKVAGKGDRERPCCG